jgi:hypothetical protein
MIKLIKDIMKKTITPAVSKIEAHGTTGANALWDGPLDTTGFPMGKGSSSGKNGMKVSMAEVPYSEGPITSKTYAKGNGRG